MGNLLLIFLLFFSAKLLVASEHPRPKGKYKVQTGYINTKLKNKREFASYYEEFTPPNFNGQTIVLIPGFSKDVTYYYEFIEKASLLKKGFRVVSVDTMLRGKSLNKNFPIRKVNGEYTFSEEANSVIEKGFFNPTAEEEARRIKQVILQRRYKEVSIFGHSRGSYLAGATTLALEKQTKTNVKAYYDIDGFVAYVTYKTLNKSTLESYGQEIFNQYVELERWLYEGLDIDMEYAGSIKRKILKTSQRNSTEEKPLKGMHLTKKEARALRDRFDKVTSAFQEFGVYFLGMTESFFVNELLSSSRKTFRNLRKAGKVPSDESYYDAWMKREALSLQAMLEVQRVIIKQNYFMGSQWTYVIPRSVLSIFDQIKAPIYSFAGEIDKVVPKRLAALKTHSKASLEFLLLLGEGHYGPSSDKTIENIEESIIDDLKPQVPEKSCKRVLK